MQTSYASEPPPPAYGLDAVYPSLTVHSLKIDLPAINMMQPYTTR